MGCSLISVLLPFAAAPVVIMCVPWEPIHDCLIEAWHEMPMNVNRDLERAVAELSPASSRSDAAGLSPTVRASHVSRERTAMRGRVYPARPFSQPADTTHPYLVLSRRKRTRTRTRCDGTRLPFAGLGKANDVVTLTLCSHPTDGERLGFRGDR